RRQPGAAGPRRAAVEVRRQVHPRLREHLRARPALLDPAGADLLRRLVPARPAHGELAGARRRLHEHRQEPRQDLCREQDRGDVRRRGRRRRGQGRAAGGGRVPEGAEEVRPPRRPGAERRIARRPARNRHDEKEQTLNQLLVEMDGFDPSTGLVLIAATNRPEILDPALLRAGRFDRVVLVDRPEKRGRLQILQVHARKIRLGPDVDLEKIAALTPGFSGADLANLVNEAALLATRRGADAVTLEDFNQAIERMVAGLEKKNRVLNETERRVVAHHEMGHAMVAMALPGTDPVHKISIIPRGVGALGYTIQRPTEDRFLMTLSELENKMAVLLGGRAAEEVIFGHQSTGAANDLAKVTDIARSMVMRYAMVESLGHIAYEEQPAAFLGAQPFQKNREYSEATAREID